MAHRRILWSLNSKTGTTNWVVTPSPTLITPARVVQAAEGANFGWIAWAWDDLNLPNCMGNNNAFGMTYNCGRYSVPSDLTSFGLDMTLNPVYGWDALATPASGFLGP